MVAVHSAGNHRGSRQAGHVFGGPASEQGGASWTRKRAWGEGAGARSAQDGSWLVTDSHERLWKGQCRAPGRRWEKQPWHQHLSTWAAIARGRRLGAWGRRGHRQSDRDRLRWAEGRNGAEKDLCLAEGLV